MPDSKFVFESGEAISVGRHGQDDFVYHAGDAVPNSGDSTLVFESGVGLGSAIIEGFEDGDVTEWRKLDGNFGEDTFNASTNRVFDGAYSGRCRNQGSGSTPRFASYPGDGLRAYPTRDDSVEFWINFDNQSRGQYKPRVATDPSSNAYVEIRWDAYNSSYGLECRNQDGSLADEVVISLNVENYADTWVRHKVEMNTGGTATASVFNLSGTKINQVNANMPDLPSGELGIGVHAQGNGDVDSSAYYDNFQLV